MKPFALLVVTLGLLAGLVSTHAAPAKEAKDTKDDLKKLEGDWTFTAWEQGGQALPAEVLGTVKWSVKGDKYTFEMGDNKEQGTIKLDPSKKPAAIDLSITEGNDKGKEQLGIYKIDGDTVTICLARPGGTDRPTDFKSTEDDGHILVTIKRGKKDD